MDLMSEKQGVFVISLDFELHWGVLDQYPVADYRANLDGVRRAIPALLDMFTAYGIHATWAIVGCLFFATKKSLLEAAPRVRPSYTMNAYTVLDTVGDDEDADPYHYAASLVDAIGTRPGQEIASHTFSHYYCLEKGQDATTFRADIQAAVAAANQKGYKIFSIVLPGNQWNPLYENVLRELGIVTYRGNQPGWLYRPSGMQSETPLRRAARLLDAYVNLSGHGIHPMPSRGTQALVNIPASRFLRPVPHALKFLEPLRLRRITKGLRLAAETGGMYHLWWHPHNFGVDVEANLAFLEKILRCFTELSIERGMQSCTMEEAANMFPREVDDAPRVRMSGQLPRYKQA
jgi:peptidoglycan/xylan/chitin deacetylase (PgdA/CDA1 family)